MKLAYASTFDSENILNWSGTPFNMSHAFKDAGDEVEYIGSLKRKLPPGFKLKQLWQKIACGQRESPRFNVFVAKHYSEQVAKRLLQTKADAVISPLINPIAYLDCKQPTVLWTDAVYAGLVGFYPVFSNHSEASIQNGNEVTAACLSRVKLAIFCSDWAARSAIELYGADKNKVKVVPYGANIECHHTVDDIKEIVKKRSRDTLKLLFIGKHWGRKGGDIVFNITKALHAAGQPVELHFVGCQPPQDIEIPPYIKCHGFISKRTAEGRALMTQLLYDSHFLFVPSRAEAFGIVFCEANAFGLPCLTSYIGGISTIMKDNINGMTFALDAPADLYCKYLIDLMQHYDRYEALALSAFNEYQTRLNWRVTTAEVKRLIQETL